MSTQSQQFWISKSVTQPQGAGSSEYRTTNVFIGCPNRWGIPFNYRRELSKNEGNGRATMRFSGAGLELSPRPPEQDTEIKFTSLSTSQLRQAAAEPTIELSEQLWLQGEYRARVTELSTAGLSKASMNCCDCVTKERWPLLQGRPRKQLLQLRLHRRRLQWRLLQYRPPRRLRQRRPCRRPRTAFTKRHGRWKNRIRNFHSISLFASR